MELVEAYKELESATNERTKAKELGEAFSILGLIPGGVLSLVLGLSKVDSPWFLLALFISFALMGAGVFFTGLSKKEEARIRNAQQWKSLAAIEFIAERGFSITNLEFDRLMFPRVAIPERDTSFGIATLTRISSKNEPVEVLLRFIDGEFKLTTTRGAEFELNAV